jgi:hypothetical protein
MTGPEKKDALRWEWRTFSSSLSDIEAKIGSAAQIAPRRSEEVYLLNSATPHSAKIREGALEVKRLQKVDSTGLELWSPAFKAAFPLSAPMLQLAFAALGLPPPITRPTDYDLDEFLTEVVSRNEALRAVHVKKARRQFVFRTCAAEFVQLLIGAIAQESFCLENEDPTSVIAALRELGLDPHVNISFPLGLKRALAISGNGR